MSIRRRGKQAVSARRLASCVWTGMEVVDGAATADRERREGGSLGGRLFRRLAAEEAALLRERRNDLLPHVKTGLRDSSSAT